MTRYRMVLLLLLFSVGINAEILHSVGKSPVEGGGAVGLEPSRASIYRHLLTEQENVKGAGEHIKNAFDGLEANIHELIESDVLPNLQLLVDGVVDHAEETWISAGNALRTAEVRSCIENSEADAQQVAKRAVEKMRGCADALHHEGDRRVREATRLLNQIDAMTKRFIGALETCVKDAEAGEWPVPTTEALAPDPQLQTPSSAVEEQSDSAVEDATTAPTSSQETGAGDTSCTTERQESTQQEGRQPKEKCKGRGRCEKGRNTDQKQKEKTMKGKDENENAEEANVDGNVSKSKTDHKQKEKKAKKKDGKQVETGETGNENEDNVVSSNSNEKKDKKQKEKKGKKKGVDQVETGGSENAEEKNAEGKNKKEKHGKKKEAKGKKEKSKDSYETKGRKSRKLLAFEEDAEEPLESPETESTDPVEGNSNEAQPKWRTQGANPEEQFVITCMQSPLMNELIEEKTRVYEKLEWMLNRVQEKEQGAQTLCIDEHLNKAQLKINAIKTKMASCAERYMREEL